MLKKQANPSSDRFQAVQAAPGTDKACLRPARAVDFAQILWKTMCKNPEYNHKPLIYIGYLILTIF